MPELTNIMTVTVWFEEILSPLQVIGFSNEVLGVLLDDITSKYN